MSKTTLHFRLIINGLNEIPASYTAPMAFRKECHTAAGQLGVIESSWSWEAPIFSVLFESVNGMEAQLARVDAAVINNVPLRIQADFLFAAIGIPILHPPHCIDQLEGDLVASPAMPLNTMT